MKAAVSGFFGDAWWNNGNWKTQWDDMTGTVTGLWNRITNRSETASRSLGGPALPGNVYRVNDDAGHRPELFVPSVPGTILNGDQSDKIMNNYNNSHTMGDLNLYVVAQGASARELADELGPLVYDKLRMSGARI